MIHNLAARMASVFVLYGESSEENADIYAYACGAVISFLVNILIGLVIAFFFGRVIEGIVFILSFALLRRYAGGHHAKTHLNCILAFSVILFLVMAFISIASLLQLSSSIGVVVATFALLGIIALAPVEHTNKSSGYEYRVALKRKSICFGLIIWSLCIYNFYILNDQLAFIFSLSLFSVFGSMAYAMMHKIILREGGCRIMKEQATSMRLDRLAVRAMASVVRSIAQDSIGARCYFMIHQPEEPKDLVERLQEMKK